MRWNFRRRCFGPRRQERQNTRSQGTVFAQSGHRHLERLGAPPYHRGVIPLGVLIADRLETEDYRVDVDERDETLGRRIREAELEKIPYVIVYGDRESEGSLAVRERGGGQSTRTLTELLQAFSHEIATIRA